jgi:ATP-binding cassette subfamily B protein
MYNTLQSGVASAERVFDLLDEPEESPDREPPLPSSDGERLTGRVEFDHVSFSYHPGTPVIEDLSFTAIPGSTVAIVGPTGVGKTTLVNLLMRFYDVDSGRILVDGVDIASVSRHSLRSRIGMVLQDTWLFSGTIAQNIAYGRPDAGNISAGEKQLITIARAFLARPQLLILDEATSSVDTRTELLIAKATHELRRDRTSFIIAHRLSTIRDADVILVMESGRIVEQGNHSELLARRGAYFRMTRA